MLRAGADQDGIRTASEQKPILDGKPQAQADRTWHSCNMGYMVSRDQCSSGPRGVPCPW
jgi:hypothetical protein